MVSKTRVGGEKDPKLDLIRSLAPDLVIANIEENRREDVEALRSWGIPVYVTYPRTVWEGIQLVRELGAVTGSVQKATELARELEARYHEVFASMKARQPVRVFCPIWRRPYMSINRETYVHDMLACAGGANIFADRSARYPDVTLDEMAAAKPEVILLPNEPYHFREPHLGDFEKYPSVPAVRDQRIHFVDGKLLSWYGPRIAEALRTLPALLSFEHPS
ncbi:MAG TPA: helical backbone metal receptor [Methylomirabilota bacterium]|nr:helical backbone metal receptor [Methylomirabilota bacterium]